MPQRSDFYGWYVRTFTNEPNELSRMARAAGRIGLYSRLVTAPGGVSLAADGHLEYMRSIITLNAPRAAGTPTGRSFIFDP
jgi:hypothetical protein